MRLRKRLAALEERVAALEQQDGHAPTAWTEMPRAIEFVLADNVAQFVFGGYEGYVDDEEDDQLKLPGVYL